MFARFLRNTLNGALDLIYPPTCLLCHNLLVPSEPMEYLCPVCLSRIHENHPVFCAKCSRPMKNTTQRFCRHCSHRKLYFDQCWSSHIYDDTMRHLIHLFKYGKNTGLRVHFSRFLKNFIKKYRIPVHKFDLIIPVPIHSTRFRERGFNQSDLIARILAEHLYIPYSPNLLQRIRYTDNQARVNTKQRWTNMKGTFRIKHSNTIMNKNILVIDDVLTTGATLSEIAFELKKAGAAQVCGLTIAIAI